MHFIEIGAGLCERGRSRAGRGDTGDLRSMAGRTARGVQAAGLAGHLAMLPECDNLRGHSQVQSFLATPVTQLAEGPSDRQVQDACMQ